MGEVVSLACVGFLVEGLVPVILLMGLDLVFLVGRTVSSGLFWGVCELSMIFRQAVC